MLFEKQIRIIGLCLACIPYVWSGEPFFAQSHAEPNLPENGIYPQGKKLLFSFYSLIEGKVPLAKMNGVTALGPYYGSMEKPHALAKKHGLPFIYTVGVNVPFDENRSFKLPTDKEITEKARLQVSALARDTSVAAWNLACEELRYWKKDEMRWLELTTSAIRSADPLKRPIYHYEPNARQEDGLVHTFPYLDWVSHSTYVTYSNFCHQRAWIRYSLRMLTSAKKRANPNALAVVPLWMAADPSDPAEDVKIRAWTRHDVYCSLVNGGQGILIWSGAKRKGFERTYDRYVDGYLSAAQELNGPLGLAKVLLFGEKRDDVDAQLIKGKPFENLVIKTASIRESVNNLSFLNVAYGQCRYLFLVNSSDDPATVKLDGLPESGWVAKQLVGDGSEPQVKQGGLIVQMPGISVTVLKVSKQP